MAECLSQVKTSMGNDALILHTRTYQTKHWLGLRKREVVEITASKGVKGASRQRPGQSGPSAKNGASNGPIPGTYARNGASRPAASQPAAQSTPQPKSLLETPAGASAAMMNLTQEVTTLKQMMKDLLAVTRQKQAPNVPEELFEHFELMTTAGVVKDLATDIIKSLQRNVRGENYGQADFMREKLVEQIEKLVPIAGAPGRSRKNGPQIVALVGPTGVGKTTTIAKMAANRKLRDRQRVGLITLDTYRIAAVDQLRRYADIIGAPLKVVGSAEELRDAVRNLSDMECVLVDTAGRSPKDKNKLGELKKLLEAAQPDHVHLVLSATASQESIELAAGQFGDVRSDSVIFTKLDEAAQLGLLLNVLQRIKRPLAYITTGQDVPDDIEPAQGKRFAQLLLGGEL
jgi:flagellar biosynthesis protein FlhF